MDETALRDRIAETARSLFERGLTHGRTGNLSARLPDGRWLVTPTGASLGAIDPARLALLAPDGAPLAGDAPSKEAPLHLAMYAARPRAGAVVHLHATHSVAVSVLSDVDPDDALPPLTAYQVMRVGTVPLLPYAPPGDPALAAEVGRCAARHHAMLLANHGPVVAGRTLEAATDAIEELEASARLLLALNGRPCRCLDAAQVEALRARFPVDC